jgi:hypothetical protein
MKNGFFHRLVLAYVHAAFKPATEDVDCCNSNVIRFVYAMHALPRSRVSHEPPVGGEGRSE